MSIYKILIITSRENNNVGGVGVSQIVVDYPNKSAADEAAQNLKYAQDENKTGPHTVTMIKLY